jgi:hypothetical protein
MRSPPNATRILNDWGIGDCLTEEGVVSNGILFRAGMSYVRQLSCLTNLMAEGETGEVIGHIKFVPRIILDFGANFCYLRVSSVRLAAAQQVTQRLIHTFVVRYAVSATTPARRQLGLCHTLQL